MTHGSGVFGREYGLVMERPQFLLMEIVGQNDQEKTG